MDKLKIKVILGSTRPERFGEKPANWITEKASAINEFEVELLDLRDYPMPFFEEPVSPAQSNFETPEGIVADWTKKIDEADGFIMVTPEYNHGPSAVLKNAIDYTFYPWHKKPVGFVSYGLVGGSNAVQQLRQNIAEVQMASVRTAVLIPDPWDIKPDDSLEKHDRVADSMLSELFWWSKTLKAGRSQYFPNS